MNLAFFIIISSSIVYRWKLISVLHHHNQQTFRWKFICVNSIYTLAFIVRDWACTRAHEREIFTYFLRELPHLKLKEFAPNWNMYLRSLKEYEFLAFNQFSIAVYAQFNIDKIVDQWRIGIAQVFLSFRMPIATTIWHIFLFIFFFSLEEKQKRNEWRKSCVVFTKTLITTFVCNASQYIQK